MQTPPEQWQKLHNGMGHSDSATLCRLLAQHRARAESMEAAKHLDCPVRRRHARQVPPRTTGLPRMEATALGELVSCDIFYVNVPTMGRTIAVCGIIS
eukprot:6486345-Amphidinium_carterae.1